MNEAHPAHHPRALAVPRRDIVHVGTGDREHYQGDLESPMRQPDGQLPCVYRHDAIRSLAKLPAGAAG